MKLQKHKKTLAVFVPVLAVLMIVPGLAHADSVDAVQAIPTTVVVASILGVMVGAGISTVKGWWTAPQITTGTSPQTTTDAPYSVKKLFGAALLAAIQAPIAIGFAGIAAHVSGDMSPIYAFLTMAMQGFTVDTLHTASKN